jgi:tetratricopeptide (TPR) repeat protein
LWNKNERDDGGLLRGAPLAKAVHWCKERPGDIEDQILEFVRLSRLSEAGALEAQAGNHRLHESLQAAAELYDEASRMYHELQEYHEEIRVLGSLIDTSRSLRNEELANFSIGRAIECYGLALKKSRDVEKEQASIKTLIKRTKRGKENEEQLEQILNSCRLSYDFFGQAVVLEELTELYLESGDVDRALVYYEELPGIYQALGDHKGRAQALEYLARLHGCRGSTFLAIQRLVQVGRRRAGLSLSSLEYWKNRAVTWGLIAAGLLGYIVLLLGFSIILAILSAPIGRQWATRMVVAVVGFIAVWTSGRRPYQEFIILPITIAVLEGVLWVLDASNHALILSLALLSTLIFLYRRQHLPFIDPFLQTFLTSWRWMRNHTIDELIGDFARSNVVVLRAKNL